MDKKPVLEKNRLEWCVFALGCVLVCGVIGYLVFASLNTSNKPVDIAIKVGQAARQGKYFRVPVEVENRGDHTAEAVAIEVVLAQGQKEVETSEFEIAFLPRRSKREAEVTFKADPQAGQLEARVLGYEKP